MAVLTPALTPSTGLYPGAAVFPWAGTRTGGPITPLAVALAVGPAGALVDVTGSVAFEAGITRSPGRTDQFGNTAPRTLTFTLNNGDGRYTPGNPLSPLATPVTEGMRVCWQLGSRLVRSTVLSLEIPPNTSTWDQLVVTCDDMLGNAARRDLTSLADGLNDRGTNLLMWRLDDDESATTSPEVHGDGLGPFQLYSSNPGSATQAVTFGADRIDGLPGTGVTITAAPGETNWFGTDFGRTDVVTRVTYPAPPAGAGGGGTTTTPFYDLTAAAAKKKLTLQLGHTSALQAAVKSPDTGEWYATQARAGSNGDTTPYQSVTISRCTASGALLDSMTVTDAGHGGGLGLEYTSGGMVIWLTWDRAATGGTDNDVVRFKYTPGTYARAAVPGGVTTVFTAAQLSATSAKTEVIFDAAHGYVMACEQISGSSKTYRRFNLADFRAGIKTQSGATITHTGKSWTLQGWQGVGDAAFIYTGVVNGLSSDPRDPPAVREYRWTDGSLVQNLDLTGIGANKDGSYPDDHYEPESFTVYQPTAASSAVAYFGVVLGDVGNRTYPLYGFTLQAQTVVVAAPTPAVQSYSYGRWSMWVYPGSTVNLAVTPKFATGGGYSDSFRIECTPTTVGVAGGANGANVYTWTAEEQARPQYVTMRPSLVWQTDSGGYWALFIALYVQDRIVASAFWYDDRNGFNVGPLTSDQISPVSVNVSVTNPRDATSNLSGTVTRVSHGLTGTGSEYQALYSTLDGRRAVVDTIVREISSGVLNGPLWDTTIGYPDVDGRNVLDVYNDIVRTEQGHMFCLTTGTLTAPVEQIKIRARDRPATVKASFDAVDELDGLPSFVRDLSNVAASMEVSGPAGKTTVTDDTVAQATSRFIAAASGETILATSVDDLRAWGQDRLIRGKNVGIRAETFTVDAMTTPTDRSADLLALIPGDRVRITGLPAQRLGFASWDGWVLGVAENHGPDRHKFTISLQPVLPDADVFDTAVLASDGDVTLAAATTATATTITVAVASGSPMSTVVPYPLLLEQEQVTVTAVTGSTLTITRGQAGTTAAAHPAGAAVEVVTPALFAF